MAWLGAASLRLGARGLVWAVMPAVKPGSGTHGLYSWLCQELVWQQWARPFLAGALVSLPVKWGQ